MYWLLGRRSTLSICDKLLVYKLILKPIWTYGLQLWVCASENNTLIIQRFQNKVLRNIFNALCYFRNSDLHCDLEMETIKEAITKVTKNHEQLLLNHVNAEVIQLLFHFQNINLNYPAD